MAYMLLYDMVYASFFVFKGTFLEVKCHSDSHRHGTS